MKYGTSLGRKRLPNEIVEGKFIISNLMNGVDMSGVVKEFMVLVKQVASFRLQSRRPEASCCSIEGET